MELVKVNSNPVVETVVLPKENKSSDQFIHANTMPIELKDLKEKSIIPVFAKDNECTISHTEFIDTVSESCDKFFSGETQLKPAIRISHPIKGRIPEAIGKPVKELTEHEKTIYYERMAFIIEIPSIQSVVNGNLLNLTIGGVRAYNLENLYSKKSEEKFKLFIGFKNQICTNLCISTDGFQIGIKALSAHDLALRTYQLLSDFNAEKQLKMMSEMGDYSLNEQQFAHLIGKAKLYHYLPNRFKKKVPAFPISDSQISLVSKLYYTDENFAVNESKEFSVWNLYNLFTEANKASYIDSFLDRGAGCFSFINELQGQIKNKKQSWYLIESPNIWNKELING